MFMNAAERKSLIKTAVPTIVSVPKLPFRVIPKRLSPKERTQVHHIPKKQKLQAQKVIYVDESRTADAITLTGGPSLGKKKIVFLKMYIM